MSTSSGGRLALPAVAVRSRAGGRLVERAAGLTLGSLAALLILALVVVGQVEMAVVIEAPGRLEPARVQHIHSRSSGIVEQIRVEPADRVEKHQVLARLDGFELERRLERLRLEARFKRHRPDVSRAEVELLEQSIAAAEQELERLVVRSPGAGKLLTEHLEVLVGAPVAAGDLLFEVMSPHAWKCVLRVAEGDILRVGIGDRVRLEIPATRSPGSSLPEDLPATVSAVGQEPGNTGQDSLTRGLAPGGSAWYRVEAVIDSDALTPATADLLRPGLSARAKIVTGRAPALDLVLGSYRGLAGGG